MNARTLSQAGKPLHALLVDDDEFMVDLIGELLRGLGITKVLTANNGTEGTKALDQAAVRPDVVVCDLNMPGADGFQFMEALAQRNYDGGVILISAMEARVLSSASLMAKFHRLNILATLEKPVNGPALAKALGKLPH